MKLLWNTSQTFPQTVAIRGQLSAFIGEKLDLNFRFETLCD